MKYRIICWEILSSQKTMIVDILSNGHRKQIGTLHDDGHICLTTLQINFLTSSL